MIFINQPRHPNIKYEYPPIIQNSFLLNSRNTAIVIDIVITKKYSKNILGKKSNK